MAGIELMDVEDAVGVRMGDSKSLIVKAVYVDGSTDIVTAKAKFVSSDPSIVEVKELGKLVAKKVGKAEVVVSYVSATGTKKELKLRVEVITPFPLASAMFNPSIWEQGTFDEKTSTLVTGQYGFGGWLYAEGLDLSAYSTLTVELGNDNDSMVSFRLFDKNNYWSKPAMYDFGSSHRIVIDLHDMKDENGEIINPSHLYIIGFWSLGFKPIVIEEITLE